MGLSREKETGYRNQKPQSRLQGRLLISQPLPTRPSCSAASTASTASPGAAAGAGVAEGGVRVPLRASGTGGGGKAVILVPQPQGPGAQVPDCNRDCFFGRSKSSAKNLRPDSEFKAFGVTERGCISAFRAQCLERVARDFPPPPALPAPGSRHSHWRPHQAPQHLPELCLKPQSSY